jgi:hypothetical protein
MTSTLKPPELLPCPFCGNTSPDIETLNQEPRIYGLQCNNPDCKVYFTGESEEEVIDKWNLRSPSPSKGMPRRYEIQVGDFGHGKFQLATCAKLDGEHMDAEEVLAALTERDREIERLTGLLALTERARMEDGADHNSDEVYAFRRVEKLTHEINDLRSQLSSAEQTIAGLKETHAKELREAFEAR